MTATVKRINLLILTLILLIIAVSGSLGGQQEVVDETPIDFEDNQNNSKSSLLPGNPIEILVDNLEVPWEIAFLPDGRLLITERPGRLVIVNPNNPSERAVIVLEHVAHSGEGGLLGMAVETDAVGNHFVYLYLTTNESGRLRNRVEKYKLIDNSLSERQIIIDNIPASANHNGGRIEFGPDGFLYITTGDASAASVAQNTNSLAGKILRLNKDGSIPEDNPFGNAVYSLGHRNPQGITWDESGRLWATEHGRSGVLSGFDEINLIEPGGNYGWPRIQGNQSMPGMKTPVVNSGPSETWAPSDVEYVNGYLFFAGLRGESLYRIKVNQDATLGVLERFLSSEFGRLRAVRLGPDGFLYVTTSNRDGRGIPRETDDKLIRINPYKLDETFNTGE